MPIHHITAVIGTDKETFRFHALNSKWTKDCIIMRCGISIIMPFSALSKIARFDIWAPGASKDTIRQVTATVIMIIAQPTQSIRLLIFNIPRLLNGKISVKGIIEASTYRNVRIHSFLVLFEIAWKEKLLSNHTPLNATPKITTASIFKIICIFLQVVSLNMSTTYYHILYQHTTFILFSSSNQVSQRCSKSVIIC